MMGLHHSLRSTTATTRFIGRCEMCVRPVTATHEGRGRAHLVDCPECGRRVRTERIYVRVTETTCGGGCHGAVGPICQCACGGENHGRTWGYLTRTDCTATEAQNAEAALAALRQKEAERVERARARSTAQRVREQAEREEAFNQWQEANPEVAAFLDTAAAQGERAHPFVRDMAARVANEWALTERQTAAAAKFIPKKKEEAEPKPASEPVPTGTVEVTGTIISAKLADYEYSRYGSSQSIKAVVACGGWRVWTTIPTTVLRAVKEETGQTVIPNDLRGRAITFTAEVTASDKDASFGFARRPHRARLHPAD